MKTALVIPLLALPAAAASSVSRNTQRPGGVIVREAKDSIKEAKQLSREQARKLADEGTELANDGRKRE